MKEHQQPYWNKKVANELVSDHLERNYPRTTDYNEDRAYLRKAGAEGYAKTKEMKLSVKDAHKFLGTHLKSAEKTKYEAETARQKASVAYAKKHKLFPYQE